MGIVIIEAVALVLAGLLAGEELIVRYGVQPALTALEDRAHILARVALVKRLKVVVPIIMVPTVLAAAATLITAGTGDGLLWRWAGMAALVAFVLFSFLGTVPINMKVNDWDADAPPADWKAVVRRWQTIDVFRSSAAIVTFVCFTVALAVQLP
ncbi:DUF1772 domain-containing protein [Leifsonia poae]|uniref:DUF1772 domain-containing protein n=1 Tax=Leifsonia poae TaxID=110933 RepID=UPI001CBFE1A8|nr:DUF1772 domain-containing protein [Leifsonia poae]